ncbi:MAG: LamG-like jellyroll fold domain-containing protein [Ignavibacteriaceae bacterium]
MNHNYFPQVSFCVTITLILLTASSHFAQVKGGRWMFENNGNDEATWDEYANNGLLSGAASYQNNDPLAQGSYYLSLEDSADYGAFTVAHHSELNFKNKNFAASLWIYPIPNGSTSPQFMFLKGDRSGTVKLNNYALRLNNSHIEFIVHLESGEFKFKKSSFNVVDNEWLFVAVFYDFDQSKLYMWNEPESAPVDTFDFNESLFPNDLKLYVGTAGENGHRRYFGRIDDLRISNNVLDILGNTTDVELSNIYSHPSKFTLNQNYPNPFNPETIIKFSLAEEGFTKLDIYNLIGEKIANLIDDEKAAGEHQISFSAKNLPSGIYFYKLQQGSLLEIKKMILLK